MASFNKFDQFLEDLAKKLHNLHSDTLKNYLSNALPVQTNAVKADIAEITAGNGYVAGGDDTQNNVVRTGAVTAIVGTDIVVTAVGGTIGPFRYVIEYNDTSATKLLVGWWDYGLSITLNIGETFTEDFGASIFTLQ